jgi:hypothetical protein
MSVLLMRHALLPVITLEAPRAVLRIVFATIIMGCCVLFFSTWNLIAVILFGIVVYSIVLFATRGLTWSEAKTFFARFA